MQAKTRAPEGHDRPFDALIRRFVAQSGRPAGLGPVDLGALLPFQRALLVSEGLVTRFLEVHTQEPVDTIRLDQVRFRMAEGDPWLGVGEGAEVGLRRVCIKGRHSERLYVYALAAVALDRLPRAVRGRLEVQGESLGRVLGEAKLETRRELLWYGTEQVTDLPEPVRRLCDGVFLSRTYRILHEGAPIALVQEKFPPLTNLAHFQPFSGTFESWP